jgi:hypothetical protein
MKLSGIAGICAAGLSLGLLASCSDDGFRSDGDGSTGSGTTGSGTTGSGGSSASGVGGATTASSGPTASGVGGAASGSGGATGAGGGSGGEGAICPSDPNLVAVALQTDGWIGCDPEVATDNPAGLQGAFYAYGDGTSCTPPANPCTGAGCCISGATIVGDPGTYWGCGLGFELNASGGDASVKQAYSGGLQCFDIALSGSSGGNEVRIAYTQAASTTGLVAPYVEIAPVAGSWSGTVCFADVACPAWAMAGQCAADAQYDLQIQIVGGDAAGAFDLCLSSLVPMGDLGGLTDLGQFCGIVGEPSEHTLAGAYRIQNNIFAAGSGTQCITAKAGGGAAGLSVDSGTLSGGDAPVAYPSIVYGWHYGEWTTGSTLPKVVSTIVNAPSAVQFTVGSGRYNAAYDLWVHPQANPATPAGGLEIMIWLNHGDVQPLGTQAGSVMLEGATWNVWQGSGPGGWGYVAYVINGQTSWTGDLRPFVVDAVNRDGAANDTWNLLSIQFGFEIWNSSPGFAVTSFTAAVN